MCITVYVNVNLRQKWQENILCCSVISISDLEGDKQRRCCPQDPESRAPSLPSSKHAVAAERDNCVQHVRSFAKSRSLSHTLDITIWKQIVQPHCPRLIFKQRQRHAVITSARWSSLSCVFIDHRHSSCEFHGTLVSAGVQSWRRVNSLKCDAVPGTEPRSPQEACGKGASQQAVLYWWKKLVLLCYTIALKLLSIFFNLFLDIIIG